MITKWLNSYKIYSLAIAFSHFLIFTYFFPMFVFYTISVCVTFGLFYAWCELMNEIESANRNQLLHLIETTTNPHTKDILCYELYLHDRESFTDFEYASRNHFGSSY